MVLFFIFMPIIISGSFIGFLITGTGLDIYAYLGIILISLIGTMNLMILINFINIYRKNGMSLEEAVLKAGVERARHILIVSLTILLTSIIPASGIIPSFKFLQSFATATAGGILTWIFGTLLCIASSYYYSITMKK